MKNFIVILFGILLLILGCSPKTAPPVLEEENDRPQVVEVKEENVCTTFADLSGTERDEVETAYVLYKDLMKEQKYTEAFPLWKKAYYGAPGSNGRVKYQYDDGVILYSQKYRNETDEALKKVYVDSVMSIYNKRVECFGGEAYILGRKAFDYYYTFPGTKTDDEIFNMFKTNFDVNGKKADYFVVNPFTKMLADKVIDGSIDYAEGRKYARLILETIEDGQANCKRTLCESWAIIADYAPARLESLEGVDDFYDCDYYAEKYFHRFEEDPENCDIINLVGRRLKRGGCTEDDPRLIAVTEAYRSHCKKASEPKGCAGAAEEYRNGRYREAIELFKNCIADATDDEKKYRYSMIVAKIYYGDLKDFPKSRQFAREAAKYDSTSGEPYMLIGKLYASSGPLCGSGRGWNSQVVTWAAIDKFEYAKRIDPSVADEANKFIRQYRQYMPKKEDIFQRRIKAGDTFKVPCWIQENTIVRTAD